MNLRGICFVLLAVMMVGVANAQRAEVLKTTKGSGTFSSERCPDFAGTIEIPPAEFDGQSNTAVFIPGPIFLCFNDQFYVRHNGDEVHCDPNPSGITAPGIGYVFYESAPTVSGPSEMAIAADPALERNPMPSDGPWWVYTDQPNGDARFWNEGFVQDFFNGGAPEQMWFAPFTMDDFAANEASEDGPNGEVNVSINEAFSVVYLNEVEITNKTLDVAGLSGSFQLVGGLPEWDGSEYFDIGIYKQGAIDVRGSIMGSGFTHGDMISFTVPEEGEYVIYVEDAQSCGATMEANFTDMSGTVTFNIGSINGERGDSQCVSFCVEDFDAVNSMQFTINFDPNYLEFNSLDNYDLQFLSDGSFESSSADNGIIRLTWIDLNTTGQTVPDGGCIFDVCFTIVGDAPLGGCAPIAISGNVVPISIEQQDPDDVTNTFTLELLQNAGEVCVDPGSDLSVLTNTCSAPSGSFTGTLSFQIFGGTGPYSYDLVGGFAPGMGSGIVEGELVTIGSLTPSSGYVLTITDATGATINQNITVASGAALMVDLDGFDPCFNFRNGDITASVTGGEPFMDGSYQYEWSNSLFNTDMIDGLAAGNYTVTVTDASGCSIVGNKYIGVDPINVSLDITTLPTCETSSNGMVTATITGGTPDGGGNYMVKWEGDIMPTSFDNGDIVTNAQVQGGRIAVEVTDDRNCQWIEYFDIDAEKELDLRFEYDQAVLCAGDSEATFRVFGEYADGETFSLDGANSPVLPVGTTKANGPDHVFFPSLGEGTYSLTVTDGNNGCSADTTFTIEEPEELIINASAEFSCTSTSGGEIQLTLTGGTPDYNVLWADGATEEDRTNLDPGEYAVTVTDMNGCQDSFDVDLMAGASASIDAIIIENIGCEGNTEGALMPVITGAVGNVTYSWEGPGGPYSSMDLSNLGPGMYFLTITDDMGCIDVDSAELVEGADFTYDVNFSPPSCTNSPDGTITIAVNDMEDYTYSWDHPNNNDTEVLTNVPAGEYFVTVTQVGGCVKIDTLTLESPASIDVQITNSAPTLCSNTSNGSVTVVASGGVVDNGNYGFFWSSGEEDPLAGNITSTANMLAAGEQYVVVVDEMCFDTLFFTVDSPDSLMLDANLTTQEDVSCFGDSDGSATLASTGGSPGYLYFWPDENVMTADITGLTAGFHTYVLADANGCITVDSILIGQPDSLIVEVDNARTLDIGCSNDTDGLIAVQVSGGNVAGGYTYLWEDDLSSSDVATGLGPGIYAVTVTDVNGCIDSTTYELTSPQPIVADIPMPEEPNCFGDRTCIGIESVVGGSGAGFRFSVNNGPLFDIDSCVSVFAGVYEIDIFDNTGCSFDTTITIEQPEELILDLGPDIEVDLGDSTTTVDVAIEGPNPIADINWDPITGFGCVNDDCSRIRIFPSVTTLYNVSVMDERGCTAEDDLLVEVIKIVRVYFPNVFSPDGDGINDIFNAYTGRGIQSIDEFRVFDRWGNEMYGIRNLSPNGGGTEGWDGRAHGSEVDPGVYTYYARVTLIDDEKVLLRGDVTLLR